jgi:DNA-binding beta-propeller fold protein YncE
MIRRQFAATLLLFTLVVPYAAFGQGPAGAQQPAPDPNDPIVRIKADMSNPRISELMAVGLDRLIVLERTEQTTKLLHQAPAHGILAEYDAGHAIRNGLRFHGETSADHNSGHQNPSTNHADDARLKSFGCQVGDDGTIYVADTGNDRVQRFTLDGGHGAEIVPPGQLANPRGIAVRGTRLFVADDQHHRLVVFDTGGHLLRAVGQNGSGPGQLNFPYGVATDAPGRVFVADDLNHRVVRFSSGPVYPYKGRWGSYGTAPGRLAYPRGIAVDAVGSVYVADTGNDRIDVFDKGGAATAKIGSVWVYAKRAIRDMQELLG